jgi:hypothetical protein
VAGQSLKEKFFSSFFYKKRKRERERDSEFTLRKNKEKRTGNKGKRDFLVVKTGETFMVFSLTILFNLSILWGICQRGG